MAEFRQEITFDAPPDAVFSALTSSDQHTAFTGAPADIDATEGGSWSAYGGGIHGHTIEVVPAQRWVQTWRVPQWPPGVWSLVRMELSPHGSGTAVTLFHTSAPDGSEAHLQAGWHERYWQPLATWLGRA